MAKRVSLRGRGADIFFGENAPAAAPNQPPEASPEPATTPAPPLVAATSKRASTRRSQPRRAETGSLSNIDQASQLASMSDIALASMLASPESNLIQQIRNTVKAPGREVSFVRLTAGEKARLGEIVYQYKRQGKKTSENEINRIAVNFILEDFAARGEASVLAQVIDALLA